jgi:rfaE bifunctional protein kinase chain/domain
MPSTSAVKVSVVGDVMLDHYSYGQVKRISPEAPVPVFLLEKEESLPGGAANVALNLLSLQADVTLFGRVGDDDKGEILASFFVNQHGLIIQEGYETPVKNRLIASSQQVMRIDQEKVTPLPPLYYHRILDKVFDADIIALSDYGKGFLTDELIRLIVEGARERNIPVLVDPKGADFTKYRGAFLIKPNLKEAHIAAKDEKDLNVVADKLLKETDADMLLVTKSEEGMTLFKKGGEREDFPVFSKEVVDVTGAGDTVLAVLTLALGGGLDVQEGIRMANVAASIAIEKVGCVRVSLPEIAGRILGKRVRVKHWFLLEEIMESTPVDTLGIDSRLGCSLDLIAEIRRPREGKLLIYFTDDEPDERLIDLLTSFKEVDFILDIPLSEFQAFQSEPLRVGELQRETTSLLR